MDKDGPARWPCDAISWANYIHLLTTWQKTHNLVAASTLADVRTRHIADSLQLLDEAPSFREWVDLGSGAGFPGLMVAMASRAEPERHFTLVESNQKKAAFLRAAIRASGANASVAAERIETHGPTMAGKADIVSARALAALPKLLGLAYPYLHAGSTVLLLKGQDFVQECELASKSWDFDVVTRPSVTHPGGHVAAITRLRARTEAA